MVVTMKTTVPLTVIKVQPLPGELRRIREVADLTVREVADRVGKSFQLVQVWEAGSKSTPTYAMAFYQRLEGEIAVAEKEKVARVESASVYHGDPQNPTDCSPQCPCENDWRSYLEEPPEEPLEVHQQIEDVEGR